MWNNINLRPPPTNSYLANLSLVGSGAIRRQLEEFLKKISISHKALGIEALIISRIFCRLKIKFRADMGIKYLEKLHKTLHKYNSLDVTKDIKNFLKFLPAKASGEGSLPTKQMLEYVLVRLQGYSKVISRLIDCSGDTAYYMTTRMKLGHFWNVALIILSTVSRVWKICQYTIDSSCMLYQDLLTARDKFQSKGRHWLEDGYVFPPVLRSWLDLRWTYADITRLTKSQLNITTYVLSDDEDDDDIQFLSQYKMDDCIVVDDTLQIANDDVQFINEYIEIIEKSYGKKIKTPDPINKTPIEIDSDEIEKQITSDKEFIAYKDLPASDIEIIENTTMNSDVEIVSECPRNLFDMEEDLGEKIKRKRKRRKSKGNALETDIQNKVMNEIKNKKVSIIDITTPKRPRLEYKQAHSKVDTDFFLKEIVPVSDSPIKTNSNEPDEADSFCFNKSSSVDSVRTNLSPRKQKQSLDHNIDTIQTFKGLNKFLAKEQEYRKNKHPKRISLNLTKSKWTELVKGVNNIFKTSQTMKQGKKDALKLAKNLIQLYINLAKS